MLIAYAQMKVVAGHPEINTKKILQFIDKARAGGADMIIFPGLAISGDMLGDITWERKAFLRDCVACGDKIAEASEGIGIFFSNTDDKGVCFDFCVNDGEFLTEEEFPWDFTVSFKWDCSSKVDFLIENLSVPFSLDKLAYYSETFRRPLIQVSCVGIQNTGKTIYTFDGASAVFNSRGEVVQYIEPFTEGLNFIELDEIDKMPALKLPEVSEPARIYRALSYGVKEFLAQIGMSKVVIGVSGGIDSAVAAALYVQVVGAENVYLVNMPSKFNSSTTKNLSEQLAKNLGCKYYVVPIQESVDWTIKQLNECGIEVSDFVKENIQARDRSSRILAAIAASIGGVFTCNANKAESTVGYATLYGDEAGFLSALADLWKYQVYDLARYMNAEIYGREVIPQGIIDIVPSAELSTAQNVDEGKGDPLKYPYHDYLFRAFAERDLTPEDILRWYADGELERFIDCEAGIVEKYFPTAQEFIADLERWWKAFTGMGVAKRIQSPPILAVTDNPYGKINESQNGWHFTRGYYELKDELLAR